MTNNFLKDFEARGFLQDCTDFEGLGKYTASEGKEKPVAYIGFDCTADSLHVGSLIQIMIIRMLQKHGIKPIILLGGGTSMIGDPSGKEESRQLITPEIISKNKAGIGSVIGKFVNAEGNFDARSGAAFFVDNADWLLGLRYVNFLRDVGKHFSVNRMLSFESVKRRLDREQNLTFLEFNYMILQAYDFVELAKKYNCRLQVGGSDQWGNIVNGTELARRLGVKEQLFGLTTPLLTTSDGAKMGKTADGAVWLSADKLSEYDYWQFWRNVSDADTIKFLKLFTDLPLSEIAELEKLEGAAINQAKIILANEATKLCHGEAAAKQAEEAARKIFEENNLSNSASLPSFEVLRSELEAGINIADLFVISGLVSSKGEVRRLIQGGGAKVNDEKVTSHEQIITTSDANGGGIIKLSSGKKKHIVVRFTN